MNDIEAGALATDITETWRLSPTKRIWREELLTWTDYDAACRAYTQLRRHRPGRDMDIAIFATEYQRQRGTTHTDTTTTGCANCTDGWNTTTYTINERTYTGVTPCTCRDGRRHVKLHRQILEAREARESHDPTAPPPADLLNDHTLFDTEPHTRREDA